MFNIMHLIIKEPLLTSSYLIHMPSFWIKLLLYTQCWIYLGCTSSELPSSPLSSNPDLFLQSTPPKDSIFTPDLGQSINEDQDLNRDEGVLDRSLTLLDPVTDLDVEQLPNCPQDRCGLECTDLQNDLRNCGFCGRTCQFPQASALCIDGECVLDQCEENYQNRDQNDGNGCEVESTCTDGTLCDLECGTQGRIECINDEPLCITPPEICNLEDDNCNGECDEGALNMGCRVQIHRGYGGMLGHIYHSDLSRLNEAPFFLEADNYFSLYQSEIPNGRPVFFCKTPDNRPFLSSQTDCGIQRSPLLTLGFWSAIDQCGSIPLYGAYKAQNQDYFYTISHSEYLNAVNQLQFEDQGIIGYVWQN